MTSRNLVAGDQGATDDVEIEGVEDLLGVTAIEGHVWRTRTPASSDTLEVTVVDAANRIVRIHYGDAPGDWLPSQTTADVWKFEIEATWPDQPAITAPRGGPVTLNVRAAGG